MEDPAMYANQGVTINQIHNVYEVSRKPGGRMAMRGGTMGINRNTTAAQ